MTQGRVLLTDDQNAAFVEGGARTCPYCDREGLLRSIRPRMTKDLKTIQALLDCPSCKAVVVVEYALVGFLRGYEGTVRGG